MKKYINNIIFLDIVNKKKVILKANLKTTNKIILNKKFFKIKKII